MLSRHLLFAFVFMGILISCNAEKEQPVTKEEALQFGKSIEASFKKGDYKVLDEILDPNTFAKRVAKASGKSYNRSFSDGVMKALKQRKIGKEIYKSIQPYGSYELVRHYEKDNKQHLVFRVFGEGGLNYHDFELVKVKDQLKAADMYIYLTGEEFSKTIAQLSDIFMDVSKEKSNAEVDSYTSSLRKIRYLIDDGKHETAKQVYDQLPQSLKKEKIFKIIRLQITVDLNDEEYQKALEDFEASYGNDASAQLWLIDSYFLKKEFNKALKAVNTMDSILKDPFLDYYRALIYTNLNDTKQTIKYLEALYRNKPDFGNGILELMANYIEVDEYEKAQKLYRVYESNKKLDQSRLSDIKLLYPDFAASLN
jgi:hypothetical protein